MATIRWKGNAPAVAQVSTVQVTAYAVGTTYSLTINGKSVSVIAQGSVNATASALSTAWNASAYPEFTEVTASVLTDTVTLTADTAGKSFTATSSVAASTGTIGAVTASVANSGPNDLATAANYTGGALPTNGDTLWIDQGDDIIYSLDALSAVTLAALNIPASYEGKIGLPEVNSDGSTDYYEYRPTYMAVGFTLGNVGEGEGQSSQRLKINSGTVQTTLVVRGTSSPADTTLPAMIWKGTHASNTVQVTKGSFGAAVFGGEAATIATLRVGFDGGQSSDAAVTCGAGVTLTTLNQSGGSVVLNAGLTTVSKTGGTLKMMAGNITTLGDDAGTTSYFGVGTIGTLNAGSAVVIDFSGDMRGCVVTNANLYAGCQVNDPFGRVTWTNPFRLVRCGVRDVQLDVGLNRLIGVT